MRRLAALGAVLVLGACAATEPRAPAHPLIQGASCPEGQEAMRTVQLFFGRNIGDRPGVTEEEFRSFVDEELTPRFPNGLTVMEGGGQWRGPENVLIREASKVVVIVLPNRGGDRRLKEIRERYKTRFNQDSVLTIVQDSCVSF